MTEPLLTLATITAEYLRKWWRADHLLDDVLRVAKIAAEERKPETKRIDCTWCGGGWEEEAATFAPPPCWRHSPCGTRTFCCRRCEVEWTRADGGPSD